MSDRLAEHFPLEMLTKAREGDRGHAQKAIADEVVNLGRILLTKNNDYGCSAWMEPILALGVSIDDAIRVRMSDKIQRLVSLLQSDKPEVDESIDDTMRDLAGYCVLYLARPVRGREPE